MKLALPHGAIALTMAAALLAPPPAAAQAPEPAPVATIVSVTGPVTWTPGTAAAFRDAKGGERLFEGAVVRTGARGSAKLKWRNGGDFELLPLSELAIPEDEGVLLNAGKVWAQFREKLLAPFYFKSPTATAVVRGTILGVEIGPDGDTTVAVTEGRVEVSSVRGGPSRMLEPGQSLTVSPFGGLGPIMPIDPGTRLFERSAPAAPEGGPRPPGPGPGGPGGPGGRPPGGEPRRFEGAVDWLQRNRANVRLEDARMQERRRLEMRAMPSEPNAGDRPEHGNRPPGGRQGPGHGGPMRERGPAATPERAFPAGRPDGFHQRMLPPPGCDPMATPPPPGVTPDCPPPPPPPPGPMPTPGIGG